MHLADADGYAAHWSFPGVTAIEYGAFMGCDNLRYVLATGDKITTLGDNLFGNGKDKLTYKNNEE